MNRKRSLNWETSEQRRTRIMRKQEIRFAREKGKPIIRGKPTKANKLKKSKRTHRKIVRMIRELKNEGII